MTLSKTLLDRCNGACELCGSRDTLTEFDAAPAGSQRDGKLAVCGTCSPQLQLDHYDSSDHWQCLKDSMWSTVPAVQVMAWRILNRLKEHAWAQDQLDMLYLDEDTMEWAKSGWAAEARALTLDCNGVALQTGDAVTLIKDLDVKGTSFTAKRGTVVRGISLTENPEHIEGKVNGTRIVILTCFVKKV